MAKTYRREILIKGKRFYSPRFLKKKDSDLWFEQMKRKKLLLRDGFSLTDAENQETVFSFAKRWLEKRMKNYGPATWRADEQRLRDYILPKIGDLPMNKVSSSQVKSLLQDITENGKAIATRTRVKALLSTLFNSALNNDPPLVQFNPVSGIKFEERRTAAPKPSVIDDTEACIAYLRTAKAMGPIYLLIASVGLMTGLRKSEMLGLTWGAIDFKSSRLSVRQRLVQITMEIEKGTKRGVNTSRLVGIPGILLQILKDYRKQSKFSADTDFVFAKQDTGRFYGPKDVWRMNDQISKKAGIKVHVHGLRHTFGREFSHNNGNVKVLQSIMGHSSSAMTDLYSELSGKRIEGHNEVVNIDFEKV